MEVERVRQVGGTLYRVHSYLFPTFSPHWAQKLAHAEYDTKPITLDDVSHEDMDAFLSTLYSSYVTTLVSHTRRLTALRIRVAEDDPDAGTFATWSAVLRLSTMWQFEGKRKHAISVLNALASPLQKLVLARAYDVQAWLHPAFVALCMRPDPLNLQEAKSLSLQDVLYIMTAREALKSPFPGLKTEKAVSAYVEKHMHVTPPSPKLPQSCIPPSSTAPATDGARTETTRSTLTLSAHPTVEEKRKVVSLFSAGELEAVVQVIEIYNVDAFRALLVDFSRYLLGEAAFERLAYTILRRGALEQPFIPVAAQLLESILLSVDDATATIKDKRLVNGVSVKKVLNGCFHHLRDFWASVQQATLTHEDFALGFAQATAPMSCIDDGPLQILGLQRALNRDQSIYDNRSANLRKFFAALVEIGIVDGLEEEAV